MDAAKHLDAKSQAWRTLAQGLGVDVVGAVLALLSTQLVDIRWTRAFWLALGVMVVKTVVQTVVAYLSRHFITPPAPPAP